MGRDRPAGLTIPPREQTVAALRDQGTTAYGAAVDVTDEAALRGFVEDAARELGGLDLLVANAGGARGGPGIADSTADDWRTSFDLDVGTRRSPSGPPCRS